MKLRYFFDYGGDCLWAGDENARESFGYPVNIDDLPLSSVTKEMIGRVGELFVLLQDPQLECLHGKEYTDKGAELYVRIVSELGPSFEVSNEF